MKPIIPVILTVLSLAAGCTNLPGKNNESQTNDKGAASFMFVQTARKGMLIPIPGEDQSYRLILKDVNPDTIYFSDRPERISGATANDKFIGGYNFDKSNPPNAAIVLSPQDSDKENILVVELTNPQYDQDLKTLSYTARVLSASNNKNLKHWTSRMQSTVPQGAFSDISLFIDDCPDGPIHCYGTYQCSGGGEDEQCCRVECGTIGHNVGYCWNWLSLSCQPCQSYSGDLCNGTACGTGNPFCLKDQCGTSQSCM